MPQIQALPEGEVREDFEGEVLRVDADGFGYIQITKPAKLNDKVGVFTAEVLADPKISRGIKKGGLVTGRISEKQGGLRVLKLTSAR